VVVLLIGSGAATAAPPGRILRSDPGVTGRYAVQVSRYDGGDEALRLPALPNRRVELRAVVTAPVGVAGPLPVVVMLHGQHSTCWAKNRPEGPEQTSWPCARRWTAVPSHEGFQQTARLLASHGIVVVSISANGINADDTALDGGALARAQLVLAHLDRLAAAPDARAIGGLIDFDGWVWSATAAVVKASCVRSRSTPAGRSRTASVRYCRSRRATRCAKSFLGVALAVLVGYCDGDLPTLEGLKYVDDTRYAAADDVARSASVLMGANHNFFNREWTPGESTAPAGDDWAGPANDRDCGRNTPARCGRRSSGRSRRRMRRPSSASTCSAGRPARHSWTVPARERGRWDGRSCTRRRRLRGPLAPTSRGCPTSCAASPPPDG
jgi:hypothetical protein